MTRITYVEENGLLKSKPFIVNGNTVVAVLNPSVLTYVVTNLSMEHSFASGSAGSLTTLKKSARNALVELGVVLEGETRRRNTNTVPSL